MNKRIISFLLAVAMLFSWFPAEVRAVEAETPVYITVYRERHHRIAVYTDGNDILFSAADLAQLSGFAMEQGGNFIRFTRGSKTVEVYTDSHSITSMDRRNAIALESDCRKIDGEWYLSGASVLPWLNVRCSVSGGILSITPNPDSLWDFAGDFSLTDYSFNFEACCDQLGVNSKWVKASGYIKNNGLKIILDLDLDADGRTVVSTQRYFDLFDDMIKDGSAVDAALAEMQDRIETVGTITGILSFAFPEIEVFWEVFESLIEIGSAGLEYYRYIETFTMDHALKLSMMQSLFENTWYSDNQNMVKAAKQIIETYQSLWKGILNRGFYDLIDELVDELSGEDLWKVLGLLIDAEADLNEQIDRISPYNTIAKSGKKVWNKGFGDYSTEKLLDAVSHAMLYLYAVEQNYRTMAQYGSAKGKGTVETWKKFEEKADEAENAYGKFLAAAMYLEYDACDYGSRREAATALLEQFGGISRIPVQSEMNAAVEAAMYLAGAQENMVQFSRWDNLDWSFRDLDGDDRGELLFQYSAQWESSPVCVLDPNHMSLNVCPVGYPVGQAGESSRLVQSNDGSDVFLKWMLFLEDTKGEGYYAWDGAGWEEQASWDWDAYSATGETSWYVGGEETNQSVFNSTVEAMDITGNFYFDSPDLMDLTFSGDCDTLAFELGDYLYSRDGFVTQKNADLDGDGDKDRVYVVFSACSQWTLYASYEDELVNGPLVDFLDQSLTVVVAEDTGEGIRVRTCRLDEPVDFLLEDTDFSLDTIAEAIAVEPGQLTVGDNIFHYQNEGTVFVQAPVATESDFVVSAEYFSITLPKSWEGYSEVMYWDGDVTENMAVYSSSSLHNGYGGNLFSLAVYAAEEDYIYLPDYDFLGYLNIPGWGDCHLVVLYPTDVQFDPVTEEAGLYLAMSELVPKILESVRACGGAEFTAFS